MTISAAGLGSPEGGAVSAAARSLASSADPDWAGFEEDSAIEILEAMGDRFTAGDYAAVRIGAAQLRRKFPDHPYVLREAGRAWINGASPGDAVQDLTRSLQLDPNQADTWFLLATAHDRLSDTQSCAQAVSRAWSLDPDNLQYAAASASIEARDATGWPQGFMRLIDLQAQHPNDDGVKETLASAYLYHACKDWTLVASEESGGALIETTKKIIRLAAGGDIAPGIYPTTPEHIKTAEVCLTRVRALSLTDPELLAEVAELEEGVRAGQRRKLRATWAELGVGGLLLLGAFMLLGQSLLLSALALLVGGGMIFGSFEPQYRANRIVLSRRGQTLGDTALGLVARQQYGGLAYNLFVMSTYPFIAAYKVYVNWGVGWLAKAPIAEVTGSPPVTALAQAGGESPQVPVVPPNENSTEPLAPKDLRESRTAPLLVDERRCEEFIEPVPALEGLDSHSAGDRQAEVTARDWREVEQVEPPSPSGGPEAVAASLTATQSSVAERVSSATPSTLFAWPLKRLKMPTLPPAGWAGAAVLSAIVVGVAGWSLLAPRSDTDAVASTVAAPSAGEPSAASVPPAPASPANLAGAPTVVDTATLSIGGATITLDGITGEGGTPALEMERFIVKQGGSVSCDGLPNGLYRCRTPEGYDIAAAALFNGAARISNSASAEYRKLQADAQASGKGFWQ